MDDITFDTNYFIFEFGVNTTWNVTLLEPPSNYFVLRIALPERISIF